MERYTEKIRIRLTAEEKEALEKIFSAEKEKHARGCRANFSSFLRDRLLKETNLKNDSLLREMRELRYEIRKIGVNVNQVTKKINAGFGNPGDAGIMLRELGDIKRILGDYLKEAGDAWESRS